MLTRALHACGRLVCWLRGRHRWGEPVVGQVELHAGPPGLLLMVHGDRTDCTVCGLATGRVWAQWVPFPGDPLDLVPIAEAASSLEDFAELLAAGSADA